MTSPHSIAIAILSAAAGAGVLTAQSPTLDLNALTPIGVFAAGSAQSIPAGPIQSFQIQENVRTGTFLPLAAAEAEARVTPFQTAEIKVAAVSVDPTGSLGGAGTTNGSAGLVGPHTYAGTFRAATPMAGKLVVRYVGNQDGATALGTVSTSTSTQPLIADGFPKVLEIPGTATPTGFAFQIDLTASAPGGTGSNSSVSSWDVEVSFEVPGATRCTISPSAASCPSGGSLTATSSFRTTFDQLELRLSGAPALSNAFVLIAFTDTTTTFPALGNTCAFLSDAPILRVGGITGPSGEAEVPLRVPLSFVGDAYLQIATTPFLNAGRPQSSNAIKVTCQ